MVRSTDVKSAILNRIFSKIEFNFCHFNLYVGSLSLNSNSYVNLRAVSDPSENVKINSYNYN